MVAASITAANAGAAMPDASAAAAAVQGALAALGAVPDRTTIDQTSFPWTYWRRRDGGITWGQFGPNEFQRQILKGYFPLHQYGYFHLNDPKGPWRTSDPYAGILSKGGSREFTAAEIIEKGWHRVPPRVNGNPVSFTECWDPQRHTYVPFDPSGVVTLKCTYCEWTISDTEKDRAEHNRTKHETVRHKDTSSQSQLARLMTEATTGQMASPMGDIGRAIETLAAGQQSLAQAVTQQGAVLAELLKERQTDQKKGRKAKETAEDGE